jgi:putative transposase
MSKRLFLESLYATLKKYPTLHLEAINTNEDHVHLQIEIPPNILVAAVVGKIKGAASAHLKKNFKFIRTMYLEGGIWSVGYFSSTVGLNEAQVKKYIAWQDKKDLPQYPRQLRIRM